MGNEQLFIDGEFVDSADGATFETRNPSDGSVLARVSRAGRPDVDRAVAAARRAFDEGPWPSLTPQERSRVLLRMATLLQERQGRLSQMEAEDAGHTLRAANLFTIPLGIYHWQYFAEEAERLAYTEPVPRTDFPAPAWQFVQREPYGVCAGIIPWNFPFLMAVWKTAPALATGNTVVLKPSPYTPLTALELARVAQEAGLPNGVLNVVPGTGTVAGEALVTDPRVDRIGFTGSTAVGKRVMQLASASLSGSRWSWGGRVRPSCWTTPTWTWPSRAPCGACTCTADRCARRARVASSLRRCTTTSWPEWSRCPRPSRSEAPWTSRRTSAR